MRSTLIFERHQQNFMMDNNYAFCSKTAKPRQDALQSNQCGKWQHRTCLTGITRVAYWQLERKENELSNWKCNICMKVSSLSYNVYHL